MRPTFKYFNITLSRKKDKTKGNQRKQGKEAGKHKKKEEWMMHDRMRDDLQRIRMFDERNLWRDKVEKT